MRATIVELLEAVSSMWTKEVFFHPLDLTILNSYILLLLHREEADLYLGKNMLVDAVKQPHVQGPLGRPVNVAISQ
jgi:hypothetical protein